MSQSKADIGFNNYMSNLSSHHVQILNFIPIVRVAIQACCFLTRLSIIYYLIILSLIL